MLRAQVVVCIIYWPAVRRKQENKKQNTGRTTITITSDSIDFGP